MPDPVAFDDLTTLTILVDADDFLVNEDQGDGTYVTKRISKANLVTALGIGDALPVSDATAVVKGSTDATKLIRLEADGLTTGTTRVLTPPDADITLPGINIPQTWAGVQTFTLAPVFTDASGTRAALGLGTAAVRNTGTSGDDVVPVLDGANTWSGAQTIPRVISGNLNQSSTNGYHLLRADGTTVERFATINVANNMDIGMSTGSGVTFIGVYPGIVVRAVAVAERTLWWESMDLSQDLNFLWMDTANSFHVGNGVRAGSNQANDLYFEVQTGKTMYWRVNAADVMRMTSGLVTLFPTGGDDVRLSYSGGTFRVRVANAVNFDLKNTGEFSATTIAVGGAKTYLDGNGILQGASASAWDVGLTRAAARVWQVTNASSGRGWVQNSAGEAALTAAFTRSDATLTATSLGIDVEAGRSYRIHGGLQVSNSVAGEGVQLDFNGGTATVTTFWANVQAVGGTVVAGTVASTSLAGALNYTSVTGTTYLMVSGYLLVNAAGTFRLRAAENTTGGGGTVTLGVGSWLALSDTRRV